MNIFVSYQPSIPFSFRSIEADREEDIVCLGIFTVVGLSKRMLVSFQGIIWFLFRSVEGDRKEGWTLWHCWFRK